MKPNFTAILSANKTFYFVLSLLFFAPVYASAKPKAAPTLTLIGSGSVIHQVNTPYIDMGATAIDDHGNDISSLIVTASGSVNSSIIGTYNLTFSVTDANNNQAAVTRTVIVTDNIAPVISGVKHITVCENDINFVEPNVSVTDNYFPTVNLQHTGSFNIYVPGTYVITYMATDGEGNTATWDRTITVIVCSTTGLATVNKDNIQVYPNPNNGLFEIKAINEISSITKTNILDVTGKTIYTVKPGEFINGTAKLNLTDINAGIYFIQMQNNTVVTTQKFIVTK